MIGIEKEKLKSYLEAGLTNEQIGDIEHFEPNSISQMISKYGLQELGRKRMKKPKKKPVVQKKKLKKEKGPNADRHLCKKCKYRSPRPEVYGCDYSQQKMHSRGCQVAYCDKYEKGGRKK